MSQAHFQGQPVGFMFWFPSTVKKHAGNWRDIIVFDVTYILELKTWHWSLSTDLFTWVFLNINARVGIDIWIDPPTSIFNCVRYWNRELKAAGSSTTNTRLPSWAPEQGLKTPLLKNGVCNYKLLWINVFKKNLCVSVPIPVLDNHNSDKCNTGKAGSEYVRLLPKLSVFFISDHFCACIHFLYSKHACYCIG